MMLHCEGESVLQGGQNNDKLLYIYSYVCVLHMHDYFRSVTGYDALTSFTFPLYIHMYIHIILLRHATYEWNLHVHIRKGTTKVVCIK